MTDSTSLSLFKHRFINNNADQTLFLLHGTGGNESDLLPLVESLGTDYNFVGLAGNVSEHGMARFFERTGQGTFNQENIEQEATKLAAFLREWSQVHHTSAQKMAFLGYSNGANMILAMLFLFPKLITKAVLLHPMLPFVPGKINLESKSVLVSFGTHDPLMSVEQSHQVIDVLKKNGAKVAVLEHEGGHEVRSSEITALQDFLKE